MKNIFIISTIKIYNGNSAGANRIVKYAKALALGSNKVYLVSLNDCGHGSWSITEVQENIFHIEAQKRVKKSCLVFPASVCFCFKLKNYLANKLGVKNPIFLLYPSVTATFDYACLIVIKKIFRYKVYYEVNELRRSALGNRIFSCSFRGILERIKYLKDAIDYRIIEKLSKYYDGLIAISNNLKLYFNKYNSNILIIPILSDYPDKVEIKDTNFEYGDCFKLAFSGSISLKKEGFDDLFSALSLLNENYPNFEFHLYGNIKKNEMKNILNDLPKKNNIQSKVFYHGVVNEKEIHDILQEFHLLILPRPLNLQTKFGFSTKLADYLVSGVPVLVTDVSDNGKYIKDGVNGYIIPPGNPFFMAEKILFIIKAKASVKKLIVENAFHTARTHFYYKNFSGILTEFLK